MDIKDEFYDIPTWKNYLVNPITLEVRRRLASGLYKSVNVKMRAVYRTSTSIHYYAVCSGRYLHRILAETFIPNPENKRCVDHIDGNTFNNSLGNLRWATHKENLNNPNTILNTRISHSIAAKKRWQRADYREKQLKSRMKKKADN